MTGRRLSYILSLLFGLYFALPLGAVQARKGLRTFVQPDGTTFSAVVVGDEHGHFLRMEDGCAVVKEPSSGKYCYALQTVDLKLTSSGVQVGASVVPSEILDASRNARCVFPRPEEPRITEADLVYPRLCSAQTRADGVKTVKKVIFVLAQFPDLSFSYSQGEIAAMVNQNGYSDHGGDGSVLDYFNDQLGEWYDFTFDVSPVVTLPKGYAYYGADDSDGEDIRPEEAAQKACELADPLVDFSQYDDIFIIYAGGSPADNSADDDHIWPHMSTGVSMRLDGKRFTRYSMSPELMEGDRGKVTLSGIGTFCHEFSHCLGLVDYYDSDYENSGGQADGMWFTTALMDGGNYNNSGHTPAGYNAVDYWCLGLGDAVELRNGRNVLYPQRSKANYAVVPSTNDGELYILECRDNSSWDRYIGGRGMLVYHIDKSSNSAGYSYYYNKTLNARQRWTFNEVNCRPDHECARILTARKVAGKVDSDPDISGIFFGNKVSALNADEYPYFRFWDDLAAPFSLSSIVRAQDGTVSFSATAQNALVTLSIDAMDVFQDAAILNWSAGSLKYPMTLSCDGKEYEVNPYSPGMYSYTLEGLIPGRSYTVVISWDETSAECTFTTRPCYPSSQTYIYLGSVEKTLSGYVKPGSRLPLRLFNAPGASVEWYWGGQKVTVGQDGYFVINKSGELRAVVEYADGSSEVIYKSICVK